MPQSVLVVDDNPVLRHLISAVLERRGFAVCAACDGEEALALFLGSPDDIALVVTDLEMPRKDGMELAREVNSVRPQLPVIFMSGNYRKWSSVCGPFPCFEKPFKPAELVREIEARLCNR